MKSFLTQRDAHYGNLCHTNAHADRMQTGSDDDDDESDQHSDSSDVENSYQFSTQTQPSPTAWTKVITITGKPGTGKNQMPPILHNIRCLKTKMSSSNADRLSCINVSRYVWFRCWLWNYSPFILYTNRQFGTQSQLGFISIWCHIYRWGLHDSFTHIWTYSFHITTIVNPTNSNNMRGSLPTTTHQYDSDVRRTLFNTFESETF